MTTTIERAATQSRTLRTRLAMASAVVGVVYLGIVGAWGDGPFTLTFDDAWYYFGIARNVADGHGSTFDGINATNGYHPLWLLLCVPAYLAGLDGMAAARALLAGQVVCYVLALVVVADTVDRLVAGWPRLHASRRDDVAGASRHLDRTLVVAWVLFTGNPFVVKMFVNGLESGISVLLYACLLCRYVALPPGGVAAATSRWRSVTGLLLLLVFLARIDAVLLVVALGLWSAFELRDRPWREALLPLAELFAPVTTGLFAYLTFNVVVFDTALPVSGLHKRAPLDGARLVTFVVLVSLGVALAVRAWQRVHGEGGEEPRSRANTRGRFPRLQQVTGELGWFTGFSFLLLGYYNALQTQQWLWYYAPLGTFALLLLPLAVADFVESGLVEAPKNTAAARALAPVQAILLVPLVAAAAIQTPRFADPDLRSIQVTNKRAGEWMDANLPTDAVAASWDAGVVGYFAGRPVVNLDGVVNSFEYYQATRNGTVGPFLAASGVGYVVNHGADVDGEDPDIRPFLNSVFGTGGEASGAADVEAEVVARFPFEFSGIAVTSEGHRRDGGQVAVFVYRFGTPDPEVSAVDADG